MKKKLSKSGFGYTEDDGGFLVVYIFISLLLAVGALFGWLAHIWIMGK